MARDCAKDLGANHGPVSPPDQHLVISAFVRERQGRVKPGHTGDRCRSLIGSAGPRTSISTVLPFRILAWEFLRRNPDYRSDTRPLSTPVSGWRKSALFPLGVTISRQTQQRADETPVFWLPEIDTSTVILTESLTKTKSVIRYRPDGWLGRLKFAPSTRRPIPHSIRQ